MEMWIRWNLFQHHIVYLCAHVCTFLNWVQSVNFVLLCSMCLVCWRRSGNECVVWYTRCNTQNVVNKVVLQNMLHSAYDIKTAYSNKVMYVNDPLLSHDLMKSAIGMNVLTYYFVVEWQIAQFRAKVLLPFDTITLFVVQLCWILLLFQLCGSVVIHLYSVVLGQCSTIHISLVCLLVQLQNTLISTYSVLGQTSTIQVSLMCLLV
jgi:hypothetical protein